MHLRNDNQTTTRFVNGLLLAWVPFLLFMIPVLASLFRTISTQKATGLGAVAGGVSEGFATFGIAAIVLTQIAAIVMLARSFQRSHAVRSLVAAASICCSLFLLFFVTGVIWLLIRFGH